MKNVDFNKLVKFIIEEPTEEDDQKRQFKYPFISCELLTCNVGIIPEQFFDREPETQNEQNNQHSAEHEMPIEEDHQESANEQTNGIQIQENSDSDDDNNDQPIARYSRTAEQLNKIDNDRMEIEKDNDHILGGIEIQNKSTNQNQIQHQEPINEEVSNQDKNYQGRMSSEEIHVDEVPKQNNEEHKNEMDISQEMNTSTEQAQSNDKGDQSTKIGEEQINTEAQEEQNQQIKNEQESKYAKIPKDNIFFDTQREVNITLAGYVAKVYLNLLQVAKNKGKEPQLIEYLYQDENNVLNITNHMHSRSCQDILVKSICFTNTLQKGEFLSTKLKVIDRLIQLISNKQNDLEVFSNSVLALTEIINVYTTYTDGKQLVEYITSKPILTQILNNLTSSSSKVVFHNASIVCVLLSLFNVVEARRNDDDDTQFKEFDISFTDSLQLFSEYIKITIDYLKNYKQDKTIKTVYNQELKPLGQARLKVVEIYCVALKLDNFYIIQEMAQHNLHTVLLELFMNYEWNNMLHTFVERIIIQSAQINSHAMRKAVFTDAKLVQFLFDATISVNSSITEGSNKTINFRKGYLGHVTKIANFIQRLYDNNPEIQEYIDVEVWTKLKETFLDQTNKNNQKELGDHAIIDPDSPQDQLHCSYDIEDVKQKHEEFLKSVFSVEKNDKDDMYNEAGDDKQENDDQFFRATANSIHDDDQEVIITQLQQNNYLNFFFTKQNKNENDKTEQSQKQEQSQGQGFGFDDQFFQYNPVHNNNYINTQEQQKFDGFSFFEMSPAQDQSQKTEDVFNSFQFSNSPVIEPIKPEVSDQNKEVEQNQEIKNNNSENSNNQQPKNDWDQFGQ